SIFSTMPERFHMGIQILQGTMQFLHYQPAPTLRKRGIPMDILMKFTTTFPVNLTAFRETERRSLFKKMLRHLVLIFLCNSGGASRGRLHRKQQTNRFMVKSIFMTLMACSITMGIVTATEITP